MEAATVISTLRNAEFCLDDGTVAVDAAYNKTNNVCSATFVLPVLHNPVQETKLPQTGDESNVLLWSALAVVSVGSMALLSRRKKAA